MSRDDVLELIEKAKRSLDAARGLLRDGHADFAAPFLIVHCRLPLIQV